MTALIVLIAFVAIGLVIAIKINADDPLDRDD